MSKGQVQLDLFESGSAELDPELFEIHDDDVGYTIMSGNFKNLDINIFMMETQDGEVMTLNVTEPHAREFYMQNPYMMFFALFKELYHTQVFKDALEKHNIEFSYGQTSSN